MKRKIYLQMFPREKAQKLFWTNFQHLRTDQETIPVRSSCGRVTAGPVHARFSSPSFHSAAMDGLAVRAEDTFGASDDSPVTLRTDNGQAVMINTGFPLPPNMDAVIMIEHVLQSDDGTAGIIRAPVYPWQNVRKVGEDIVATELLFPTGHQIKPADVAALLTGGCSQVAVRKRPKVSIIPTGSELVDLNDYLDSLPPGKIIESNSAVLAAMAEQAGAEVIICPIVSDDFETIKGHLLAILKADADLVVINAGSSAGSADYTMQIISDLGETLVHGVTMMPGKPTVLGVVDNKPVVGIPGYPVSAIIAMEQFVLPLLAGMQGLSLPPRQTVKALLAKDLPSPSGIEEFRRMTVGRIGDRFVAVPLKKGSGAITSLTKANGILRIEASSEGKMHETEVEIELLVPQDQVERTLLCTGSHDLCLDVLNDLLQKGEPARRLASTNVGSLGGIIALKQGMCHLAGSHLLDPDEGNYNVSYVKKYLPGRDIRMVTLVHRQQGFIVPRGNPKNIRTIHDLLAEGISFINRQAGSGTRVLLDYELQQNGLDPNAIKGYRQDEYTHMAVAVAVLSGKVDVGLGIRSAANALGLDFVPLAEERYDLLIPGELFESPMIMALLDVVNSLPFRQAVEKMGGYSVRDTGRFVEAIEPSVRIETK